MPDEKTNTGAARLPERDEEARNLAQEGLEERRNGNREEGEFLINQARQLDPQAVDAVVRDEKK